MHSSKFLIAIFVVLSVGLHETCDEESKRLVSGGMDVFFWLIKPQTLEEKNAS